MVSDRAETASTAPSVIQSDRAAVLMIAYEFPPTQSSGCSRPLANTRYLRDFGFEPIILTVDEIPGWTKDYTRLDLIPKDVIIRRLTLPTWNASPAVRVRYLSWIESALAKPEGSLAVGLQRRLRRWFPSLYPRQQSLKRSWRIPVIRAGMEMIQRFRPRVIWATAPPFETLKAACVLSELSGVPLLSDLRDPWTHGVCWRPSNRMEALREHWWEQRVLKRSSRVVWTTPLTEERMRQRYPTYADRFVTITNGFEELGQLETIEAQSGKLTFSYIGAINSGYRNPTIIFDALSRVREEHPDIAKQILVRLIGPVQKFDIAAKINAFKDTVEYVGPVSYSESLGHMGASDVLLLLQQIESGSDVISAKTFEYLRAKKPIISIVSEGGGDEWLLRQAGVGRHVGIGDAEALSRCFVECFHDWKAGKLSCDIADEWLLQFDRRALTSRLAQLMWESVAV